ncbi:uncharacterized protein PG998_010229 [Apiospora kogelbergensis]|uniref:uncharacterized protein n=1 Tax=Apiospora kogelbergensis TaxID=1337665 RepID=UPI00312F60C3
MRFSTFATSVALLFGSAAPAAPTASPAALMERAEPLNTEAAVDFSEESALDFADGLEARAPVIDTDAAILEARKPKWEKVSVSNKAGTKGNKGGKITQKEWGHVEDLAQKALYQADCTSGDVTYKWHQDGSQDPEEHFTIHPTGGSGASKGEIHVHKNGSWTQGKGGAANHGNGQV